MTHPYTGDRGAPTALLIVFIILVLFFGVLSYVIYTNAASKEKDYEAKQLQIQSDSKKLEADLKSLREIYKAMGFNNAGEIDDLYANSFIPADCALVKAPADCMTVNTTAKLEAFLDMKFAKRDELIKKIGVEPLSPPDDQGHSPYLESTITAARKSGVVPDNLKASTVGDLVDQFIRFDKATAARADFITQGEEAVKTADAAIVAKQVETKAKFGDLDGQADKAWQERGVEENKIRIDRPGWDAEIARLEADSRKEKARNEKFEARLKVQKDLGSPADGLILTYDWHTRRGTVNLGTANRVKPGYEFSIYTLLPGGDVAGNRVYRGKLKLLDVGAYSSLFSVVPSGWDSEDKPIMEGQHITSTIFDNVKRKNFCLKGWFREGSDHSKQALAGMIFRAGGNVQDELTLDTDYLIVGTIDEEGLTNLTPEAKAAIEDGKKAYDEARADFITVLTIDKLFKYLDNASVEVEK